MSESIQAVVPWRNPGCSHRVKAWEHAQQQWPDIVIGEAPEGPWNIAAALNNGIAKATADILILTGADVVVDRGAYEAAIKVAEKGRWAQAGHQYMRLKEASSKAMIAGVTDVWMDGSLMESYIGLGPIVAPRQMLVDIGYDERFVGWGGEDDAFGLAMATMIGKPKICTGTVWLLWHPVTKVANSPAYKANLELLKRYQAANGHKVEMQALLDEPGRKLK
jgi:glycosyltransferase involved in cell wall biosynthesis